MQANPVHVYLIGGIEPSLVIGDYEVARSCLRIDLGSGVLQMMRNMLHARSNGHGAVLLGKQIYVVGG